MQYWRIPNRSTKRKEVYFWCGQKLLDAACVFQLIFDTKKEKYCTKNYQSFWHKENQFWYCKLKANQRRFKTVDTFVKSKLQKWCIGWPSYHWLPGNGQMGQNLCSTIHHRLWNIHHRTTTRNIDRIPDVSFWFHERQLESCLPLKQQQLPFGMSVLLLSAAGAKVRSQGKARRARPS